ncbi:MAG: hypothetical protein IKP73_09790 [Bacteroidales bacterium]|nr:hypothetical protein [Bacteroidales bacterium]
MKTNTLFTLIAALLMLATATATAQNTVQLTQNGDEWYVNMPQKGTSTLTLTDATITTFKVYDDGGKNGNYSSGCKGTLVLTAPEGYDIQLSGNITTETYDKLTVYDNNEASGNKLISEFSSSSNATLTNIPTTLSTGQSITLYFYSDNIYNYKGLDLTIRIFDPNEEFAITIPSATTGGSISAIIDETEVTSANPSDVVTLTASPDDGYMLSDLTVTDADNKIMPITRNIWSNTATFTMPLSAVSVTPTFTNNLTADGGLYINMPATGTQTVTIPAHVTSFRVYDDGGKDGKYSSNCDGTLVLTAPDGYNLQLSGNITTEEDDDRLTVYDNNEASGDKLISELSSRHDNVLTNIPTTLSTGQSITLYYHSNGYANYAGFNLTVRIFDPNEEFAITIPSATTGGSLSAKIGDTEVSSAKPNNVVTLTTSPNDGYLLRDLIVTDADNNIVPITWNIWSNTATFIMPGSAVTVKQTFTNNKTADDGLYINMPATGTQTAIIPADVKSFKVYDDGGKDGNYSNYSDGILVLTAPEGYGIQLSGNITTEGGSDKLTVYDNNEASGNKLINELSSSSNNVLTNIPTTLSTGQSITLFFYSGSSTNYAGLDITASIFDANEEFAITIPSATTGGSISAKIGDAEVSSAKPNNVVTLTASPDDGYLLRDLTVTDNDNNIVPITWVIWPKTATFIMPGSDVTVTPTFTNNLTADGGIYINMPATGTQKAIIPAGVKSFKVYDDGGKDGEYSKKCDGTLILTAPEGYTIQLSGNIATEKDDDKLTVYDNNEASGDKLISELSSSSSSILTNIPTVLSTGQSITLFFHSDGYGNYAGLDLTVRIFDPNEEFAITIPSVTTGGSISAKIDETEVSSAKPYHVVTLAATPEDGYLLSDLTVTDTDNNIVPITWNIWTNTATFTMPLSVVTVTPTFTNNKTADDGLYINMPVSGTQTVTIPTHVTSFKVYDDGGKDGNYSNSCDGTLILTAPEGYGIQLSGNITTEEDDDRLTVYDNNEASGDKLISELSSSGYKVLTNIPTVLSTGLGITLFFYSDGYGNYAGLDLTVRIYNPNEEFAITIPSATTGGSILAKIGDTEISSAKPNNVVTLTATPADGYLLSDLIVTDADNNVVPTTWNIWPYTATFTMPASDVTVTPTFTNNLTTDGGLYINMPATGTQTVTIPDDIISFKVYDDGGKDGNYSNNCDGTLILTAPEGYGIQLSGSITTHYYYDKLTIYDNNKASGTKLLDGVESNESTDILLQSTSNSMTLYFNSNNTYNIDGLDLTATLISPNILYDITINQANGGSVSAKVGDTEAASAKHNDVVAITASPETDFLLSSINVVNADGNAVPVSWNGWAFPATFTMPRKDVSITPTFTNNLTADGGLFINMAATGTQTVTIPDNVTSFKIYDNGGKDGKYSNNCNGTLVLTAPGNYYIQLSGNISTYSGDILTVYDNNEASGDKLINEFYARNTTIQTVLSSGQSITLFFHSDVSGYMDGLDLTATLVDPNQEFNININTASNGTITATIDGTEVSSAKINDVITLTTVTDYGYILSNISIVDANGNTIYSGNSTTFRMPISDVTITPTFADNRSAITKNDATGGSISTKMGETEVTSALQDETITITATPENGYILTGISVTDNDGKAVPVAWAGWYAGNSANTATFTMPSTPVTITPTFSNNLTADGGLYINMPATGTLTATIPAPVKSFKIYDDGGKDGLYSDYCDGTLIMTAPEGYKYKLSSEDVVLYKGTLTVYDNNAASGKIIVQKTYNSYFANFSDVLSSGPNMTINLADNSSKVGQWSGYKGIDLTAICLKPLSHSDITVAEIPDQPFTGEGIEPEVIVKDGEITLEKGTDYTVEYSDNTSTGTSAKIIITGTGNYIGSVEKTFQIVPSVATYGAITTTTDENGTTAEIDGNYDGTDAMSLPTGGITVNSVVLNRTFEANKYSTIVLPFEATLPNALGTFYTFQGVDYDKNGDSKWTANVTSVEGSILSANTPYIFLPNNEVTQLSWNITTLLTTDKEPTTQVTDDNGDWTFTGTYQKKVFGEMPADQTYYGFAGANNNDIAIGEFVRGGGNAFVRPFRCYLAFDDADGLSKSALVLPDRIEVRVVSGILDPDDPQSDPSGDIETPTSEIQPAATANVWSYSKTIYIAAAPNTPYTIVDVNGRPLRTGITATDRDEVRLGRGKADGIVIVIVGDKSFKIRY